MTASRCSPGSVPSDSLLTISPTGSALSLAIRSGERGVARASRLTSGVPTAAGDGAAPPPSPPPLAAEDDAGGVEAGGGGCWKIRNPTDLAGVPFSFSATAASPSSAALLAPGPLTTGGGSAATAPPLAGADALAPF